MRLHIMSDLHLEFGDLQLPKIDRDLLILAGDIHVGRQADEFIKQQLKISPVIYILGNHEFYNNEYNDVRDFWINKKDEGLYVLENKAVEIDGITFFGCALWTDFKNGDLHEMNNAMDYMTDYRAIKLGDEKFSPGDSFTIHKESVKWLRDELSQVNGKKIIITHHLPTFKSIHEKFHDSPVNGSFYSDLEYLIKEYQPNMWIHGHTHESFDYMIDNTRIVCNPRGYDGYEPNPNFRSDLIIEI